MYANQSLTFLKKGVNFMDKRYMALGTSMLVLKLLKQQSMYGYQIIRELEQQSQNVFRLQEGTLYPVLHTLEQQGAVTSLQQTSENGRLRKYYALTTHGETMLDEKLKEWEIYQTAINQVIGGVLFE
jgi:DNA-binding PadR family transcriptional regulator